MSKKSCFRGGPIEKQPRKRTIILLRSASHHLYHLYWTLPRQLSYRKSLILTCLILGLLVNTLAASDKYPVLNRENLTITIEMQLSQKQNTFSEFFSGFIKCSLNLEHFEGKGDSHRFCISEIAVSENVVR